MGQYKVETQSCRKKLCRRKCHPAYVQSLLFVRLLASPWTVPHQSPLSMGFSRQEYWNGLPFPSPGDLPDPRIEATLTALQMAFFVCFTAEPLREDQKCHSKQHKQTHILVNTRRLKPVVPQRHNYL